MDLIKSAVFLVYRGKCSGDDLILGRPVPTNRGTQQLRDGSERGANVGSDILDYSSRDGLRILSLGLADVRLQLFVNSAEVLG